MNETDKQDIIKLCELIKVKPEWFPEFDDFTATPAFLIKIVEAITETSARSVVECGSGISTLVIARALELSVSDGQVISLEHDPTYSTRTYTWLKERGLEGFATVEMKPLVGSPPWYNLGGIITPKIDVLVIDAPPGYIHPQSRYGAVTLFPMLRDNAIVLADDSLRESSVIAQWQKDFPRLNWELLHTERGLAIGKLGAGITTVLVAVPTNGKIHKHVSLALLKIQLDTRYKCRIITPTHSPSDNNRHHIFKDFLAGGEDYLLMIDSDNPPISNPLDLIALNRDVIGCPTPVWHFTGKNKGERPIYENAYKYVPEEDAYTEWPVKEGIQRVDAIGTGCILIARRVLEHPDMRKGANQRTLYPDGTVKKGGDIMFCETAKKCGFEIYAHYNYRCLHFQEVELHEVARAFGEMNRG